jgi:hypothetical protein
VKTLSSFNCTLTVNYNKRSFWLSTNLLLCNWNDNINVITLSGLECILKTNYNRKNFIWLVCQMFYCCPAKESGPPLFTSTASIALADNSRLAFRLTEFEYRKRSNLRMIECLNDRMIKCSNDRMFEWSNVRMIKCSKDLMFECSNDRMFEWSNVRMIELSNYLFKRICP